MDADVGTTLKELAIWKDKYSRLAEQQANLLNQNQDLEDRLINVVDKIERDKSLLSDEIDHLAEKLACATNTIDYMKGECARYKSDCMLAVHLLQCQPSFYTSQHLRSLPAELKQKLCADPAANDGNMGKGAEKKIVHFSASAMTFPPTAVFMQAEESVLDEAPPDEPDSRHDVRDVFVKKILMAPEYQTEKLVQCPKCGFSVVKYDRCTQTIGDSYLSNSRSAPHLFAFDDDSESEQQKSRKRRSTSTGGGELLIDLSDDDRTSAPTSPAIPLDGSITNPVSNPPTHQVRFNVSPIVVAGVHHHHRSPISDHNRSPISDSSPKSQTTTSSGGGKYEQARRQEFMSIPISDDG